MPQLVAFAKGAWATWAAWAAKHAIAATIIKAAASYAISRALAPKAPKIATTGSLGSPITMSRESAPVRRVIYGRCRVSGPMGFGHINGTTNERVLIAIPLATHEVDAIEDSVWLNDEPHALETGATSFAVVDRLRNFAWITRNTGSDTQGADPTLLAFAPEVWTANHRLRGTAYISFLALWSQDVWPNGLPNVSVMVRGKKLYDPRTGTTVWSANPALIWRDYMVNPVYGLRCSTSEIDDASVIAAANICDEAVALNGGGTEKRYECHAFFAVDATPVNIIEQILATMAGSAYYAGGKWIVYAGAYRTPTETITLDDLAGPYRVQTKDSIRDAINRVRGTLTSPEDQHNVRDFPAVTNATYLSEDGGTEFWHDLPLEWVQSSSQCQRLAKIALEQSRQDITVTLVCKLSAMRIQAGDNFMLTISRLGWSSKVFTAVSVSINLVDMQVEIVARETASAIWDWASGEETAFDPAPNTNLPSAWNIAAPTSLVLASGTSQLLTLSDGTVIPRIRATWTAPADEAVKSGGQIEIQAKKSADSDWGQSQYVNGAVTIAYIAPVADGVNYDVRIRAINASGVRSSWVTSSSHAVAGKTAAPNAPTGFSATAQVQAIFLKWTNPSDADLAEIEIFESATATPPGSPTYRVSGSAFIRGGFSGGELRYYWIRARDTSGNVSASVGPVNATAQSPSGGGAGADAVSAVCSHETHAFPADSAGNVGSYAGSGAEIRVYQGATELAYDGVGTTDGTWKAVATPTNITTGSLTDSGSYLTIGNHSGLAAGNDTASISYSITGKTTAGVAFAITKTQTFSKAKAGTNGTDATSYWMVATASALKLAGSTFTPATVTFTAKSKTGSGSPADYSGRFIIAESTNGTSFSDVYTSSGNESSKTHTPSGNTIRAIRCRLYAAGGTTTLLDEQISTVVLDGANGADGATVIYSAGGASTVSGTSWQAISALYGNPTVPAGTRLITFSGELSNASGGSNDLYYSLHVNGASVVNFGPYPSSAGQVIPVSLTFTESVSAGARTYQMYAKGGNTNSIVLGGRMVIQ